MCLGSFKSALEDVLLLINANIAQRRRDFFDESSRIAASSNIGLPSLPRLDRRSSGGSQISSDNDAVSEYFINLYGKVCETASATITSRFRAEDLKLAYTMERVLLKGTDMSFDLSDAMRQIEAFFPRDDANGSLGKELAQLSFYIASKSQSIVIIDDLINVFRRNETLQILLPNVSALLKLFLVLPCTTCEAERSLAHYDAS